MHVQFTVSLSLTVHSLCAVNTVSAHAGAHYTCVAHYQRTHWCTVYVQYKFSLQLQVYSEIQVYTASALNSVQCRCTGECPYGANYRCSHE